MEGNKVSVLIFFVNGKKVVENDANPEWTLLYYLRNKLSLCGTKLGCAEGGCGACTVMVSKYDRKHDKLIHLAINACLARVCSMHGLAITTVEGIGSTKSKLHPVQERLVKYHGSQCGFCTPGIVMSMYTLLRNMAKPSIKDLEVAFQGNLCRCTGYRPIIEGFKTFTEEWELMQQLAPTKCSMGKDCCKLIKNNCSEIEIDEELPFRNEFTPLDPTQEPIFPPELKLLKVFDEEDLIFRNDSMTWYRPTKLETLLSLKRKYPEAKIVVGNTEIGVETKFKKIFYSIYIKPDQIKELHGIELAEDGLIVGAATSLEIVRTELRKYIQTMPENKTRIFSAIDEMLHYFAGKQIRNVAAIGGNIMTGSPISDLNPIFIAARVELVIESLLRGKKTLTMDEKFYSGYRKNVVEGDEVLMSIKIPFTKEDQYFYAYKQARRKEDDIAIVNSAFNVIFEENLTTIKNITLAFGGIAPTIVEAHKTSNILCGQKWNEEMLQTAFEKLIEDTPLPPNAPGGMVQYRRSLVLSMFFRMFLKISDKLKTKFNEINFPDTYTSGADAIKEQNTKSAQFYEIVSNKQNKTDTVGKPIPHAAAFSHVTGEAIFCDDVPKMKGELFMCFVLSNRAYANILAIDATVALKMNGVHAFYSAKDLERLNNKAGTVVEDQEIFVSKTVTSKGQIIGAVIAEDQLIAKKAADSVKIEYEDLKPLIISIEDAIKYKSFFNEEPITYVHGDTEQAFIESDHVLQGNCRTGGQEHFYLETNCCIVIPKVEDDEMEIIATTQNPTDINNMVSRFLQIPLNKIVTKVKRIGGGFGGKESRPFTIILPAAFAAKQLGRPIRCMLDRDEDILITGGRHPFLMNYKVGFNRDGKLNACEVLFYNNGGYSLDLSGAVMERALTNFENAYHIPNVKACGYACKTNLRSNTVFRGSGAPQSMLVAEYIIRDVAEFLKKDALDVAYLNLYRDGDITYYNQKITHCTLQRCWNECLQMANFHERKTIIADFNKQNRWKKRGMSIVPTKFGIAFNVLFLNQACALVMVYTDGTVLLTHGGAEMGQGLHTKMIQIASRVLEVPISKIHITETSTDKVPNTSPSAASASSDLNGMAVLQACEILISRISKYKHENPSGCWEDWIKAAYLDRVSLSAVGFYKTPDIGYDPVTNSGQLQNYFTYGVACTEVLVDCLTGDHQVLKTDIVMDVGNSLNPAIDIGQIEGGFMQGYGLYMLEEMMFSADGSVLTTGPGAYKLPGFGNIPIEFNVALLKEAPNLKAVYSSKGIGEPPVFLASSVLFAAREAIAAARKDSGIEANFHLNAPATSAAIRLACEDEITSKIEDVNPSAYVPWNVIP